MNKKRAATGEGTDADAAYATLVARFAGDGRVTLPSAQRGKFGSNSLRVEGKIFAMLVKGALAVKLPPEEVRSATIAGRGEPLSMGPDRVMKEWLLVKGPSRAWYAFAERARAFVAAEAPAPRPARTKARSSARGPRRS